MNPQTFLATVPPVRVEYWADGTRVATRQAPASAERFTEESEFFCCNLCGEVWGWIYYPNRHWLYIYQDCVLHNTRRYADDNVPGSMLGAGLWELDHLPLPVLKREFEVHLKELERRQRGNTDPA